MVSSTLSGKAAAAAALPSRNRGAPVLRNYSKYLPTGYGLLGSSAVLLSHKVENIFIVLLLGRALFQLDVFHPTF